MEKNGHFNYFFYIQFLFWMYGMQPVVLFCFLQKGSICSMMFFSGMLRNPAHTSEQVFVTVT